MTVKSVNILGSTNCPALLNLVFENRFYVSKEWNFTFCWITAVKLHKFQFFFIRALLLLLLYETAMMW